MDTRVGNVSPEPLLPREGMRHVGNTQEIAGATGTTGPTGPTGGLGDVPISVTGSRGDGSALASLLTQLASNGLITDSSTT
jgi:hypothetical protein